MAVEIFLCNAIHVERVARRMRHKPERLNAGIGDANHVTQFAWFIIDKADNL